MQIMKITLIQFLDNSYAKIFHKHLGAVKIKVNIFKDIFEVKDHPLFMSFVVKWWWQTFFRYSSQKLRRGNTTQTEFTTQKRFSTTQGGQDPLRKGG